MSPGAGIDEVDRDLGILDPSGRAGVLALDPDSVDALFHVAGLVDDEHRGFVVEVLDDVFAHVVADGLGIPGGPAQQMLHTVRHRWVVERTVSWLAGCRRLHRRYGRKAEHFLAFLGIAATLISYRRLTR